MIKILLLLTLLFGLTSGATLSKATGCDLSQDGKVELNILGYASTQNALYTPIAKVGKNFRTLFIGSTIQAKDALVTMTDIQANKREKGLPRTGVLTISLELEGKKESIKMTYMYEQGHFIALGKQKNKREINFSLYIKALLCYSK